MNSIIFGGTKMKQSSYKAYEDLPLFLNVKDLSSAIGIAPSSCYELMHEKDFPSIRIGKRLVVPRDKFIEWVEKHSNGGGR
jgi:predicted DNA-binding transcriptional regulator AlpA